MYAALAVIMLALAAFTVLVVRRGRGDGSGVRAQLESFGYLGAGAMAVLAAAVLVLGLAGAGLGSGGRPELLAMIGLFGYVVYLAVAFVLAQVLIRRAAPGPTDPLAHPLSGWRDLFSSRATSAGVARDE